MGMTGNLMMAHLGETGDEGKESTSHQDVGPVDGHVRVLTVWLEEGNNSYLVYATYPGAPDSPRSTRVSACYTMDNLRSEFTILHALFYHMFQNGKRALSSLLLRLS